MKLTFDYLCKMKSKAAVLAYNNSKTCFITLSREWAMHLSRDKVGVIGTRLLN